MVLAICALFLGLSAPPLVPDNEKTATRQSPGRLALRPTPGVRTFVMIATDFRFSPSTITVLPGQRVIVKLVNRGKSPHNIVFDLPDRDAKLRQNVRAGGSNALTFTAPSKPGTHTFYCPVGDHRKHGMTGRLIVAANAKAAMTSVTITATDFRFSPATIKVRAGRRVRVTLLNRGKRLHNIEFELPQGEVSLDRNVSPGRSSGVTFTAPGKPGTYTFYCPIGDHRAHGMQGKLIVLGPAMKSPPTRQRVN